MENTRSTNQSLTPKLLVVTGPTGVGKTATALALAKKFGGVLVSADSRQVYQGMTIGTGKDITAAVYYPDKKLERLANSQLDVTLKLGYYDLATVPLWLLDLVPPDVRFTVSHYRTIATLVINHIWHMGKLPILVGGTGFYLRSLFTSMPTLNLAPNPQLRYELAALSVTELQHKLTKVDPKRFCAMNQSDQNNPRRLIRAIEVAGLADKPETVSPLADRLTVALDAPNAVLYQKITERINARLVDGLEAEIRGLLTSYSWTNSALGSTIAYQEWQPYFAGKSSLPEVITSWTKNEVAYVKRQRLWYKNDPAITVFDISTSGWFQSLESQVSKWYNTANG